MKYVIGALALAALLGAVLFWVSTTNVAWKSAAVLAGVGLGLIAAVGFLVTRLREHKRRQLLDMRDSALW